MQHVIVEGRYPEPTTPEPTTPEAVIEGGRGQRFCFDLSRSHPVTHYLVLDGAHICCVFRAPDADSVRRALVLVERDFAQPVDFAAVQGLEDAGSWCLDQHHIRFLGTFFARDRRRMICLYAAPDAESVRLANRRLQLPFTRAWAARVFGPDASPAGA